MPYACSAFAGASQVPKDRLDPYLTTCSSKHWQSPTPSQHRPHHPASSASSPASGPQARSKNSRPQANNNTSSRPTTQQFDDSSCMLILMIFIPCFCVLFFLYSNEVEYVVPLTSSHCEFLRSNYVWTQLIFIQSMADIVFVQVSLSKIHPELYY